MTPGPGDPVVHLELHTGDADGAQALYAALCGWQPRVLLGAGTPYLALELGRRIGGGIVECDVRRPLWLPYVEVADAHAAAERARSLGARVLLEPQAGPAGTRAVVRTQHGAEVAFWQPDAGPRTTKGHGR